MLWNKTYGSGNSEAYSIVQTADGGFVLAGVDSNHGYVVRTDSVGNVMSTFTDGTDGTGFYSVTKTLDGRYAVAGSMPRGFPYYEQVLLEKLDSSLTQEWWQAFGGTGDDRALSVIQATDGGYVLAGWYNGFWGSPNVSTDASQKTEEREATADTHR